MRTFRATAGTSLLAAVLALGAAGCGSSDEERIRSAVGDLQSSLEKRDADRACALLTPRAEAQYTGLLGALTWATECRDLVKNLDDDNDDERQRLTVREIDRAKIAIRGDLATFTSPADGQAPLGMRKIDGDWRIDNILDPSLRAQQRGEERLTRGTDEQQIRATLTTFSAALDAKDHRRVCNLLSYGAEAQIFAGAAFASLGVAGGDEGSTMTCVRAWRMLERLADDSDGDSPRDWAPPPAAVRSARITIRDERATVVPRGSSPMALVRVDGRWLVDGEASQRQAPADYERCWRAAGARIATGAADLRFAGGRRVRHISSNTRHVSVKGDDFRIFYTLPPGGEDPGLDEVLADPAIVAAVAYVEDASDNADIVTKARACGT